MSSFLPLLGAVAALVTLLWLVQVFVRLLWAKRGVGPLPGPVDAAFSQLPPAVVDLLTENGVLADEAAAATLLDLAARGRVDIEEVGPKLSLVRLRRSSGSLLPHEQLVLDRVTSLARTGVVATRALAESSLDAAEWWKSFELAVVAEARALGLTRRAGGWGSGISLVGLLAAALWAVLADFALMPLLFSASPEFALAPAVFFALFFLTTAFDRKLGGERLTALGRRAAGSWLTYRDVELVGLANLAALPAAAVTIWGRPLAYAAAFRLTRTALASLPLTHQRDLSSAWSDHGGLWHRVVVRYPGESRVVTALVLGWVAVAWIGGMLGVSVWYALRPQGPADLEPLVVSLIMVPAGGLFPLAGILLFVPFGRLMALSWVSRARSALGRDGGRFVTGTVIRLRLIPTTPLAYLAIDSGAHPVRALRTLASAVAGLAEGDSVRVTSAGGYVCAVESIKSPPG